ncbi:MAG: hypothetical protein ACXVEF_05970 [Polyangiales bacterium]
MRTLLAMSLLVAACGAKTQSSPDAAVDASTDVPSDTDAAPDYARCALPGSCIVVAASCCGSCGAAVPSDMIGIESSQLSAHRSSVCTPGTGCPACFMRQDPFLQAFCTSGRCEAIDLHGDALTECATDADCVLRYESCCGRCDASPEGLIALRVDRISSYREKVCAPSATCPECVTRYPDSARPVCDATKHCNVTGLAPF